MLFALCMKKQNQKKSSARSKRVLVLSDFHCGHVVGLTPPGWQWPIEQAEPHKLAIAQTQRIYWDWYESEVREHGPYDVVFLNGDAIDGNGHRSGGTEQLTTDRQEQAKIAKVCLRPAMNWNPRPKLVCTYGTAYHTGDAEDFESEIPTLYDGKIGGHEWVSVNGLVFDLKHHCGSSGVPHGRHTAQARERLWNVLWHEAGNCPKANVIIRSHVHYYSGSFGPNWLALTTPALQGLGSKYGERRCSGIVDFGFLVFDVQPDGGYTWRPVLLEQERTAEKLTEL